MRWSDARAIFGLLGELRDLGDDPAAWRSHMAERLCRLVGARVGLAVEVKLPLRYTQDDLLSLAHVGWQDEGERDLFCALHDDPTDEVVRALGARPFTRVRSRLVDDRRWQRARFSHELRRIGGLGEFVLSHQPLAEQGVLSGIALYRSTGERLFSAREVSFIDRFHRELAMTFCEHDLRRELAPRVRETLGQMLIGSSEKEIADALTLSPNTVHQYVKAIYRRFGVRSRAELHARAARILPRRPRLAIER
jgi:DNA-binding CsgD family transcriptional regulator